MRHWLEPTCADRPLCKSLHGVPPFRRAVCRCVRPVLYAGLLLDDRESECRAAHLRESEIQTLTFRLTHFGPGFSIRVSLSCSDDASNTHSLRGHDSQKASFAASDLRF